MIKIPHVIDVKTTDKLPIRPKRVKQRSLTWTLNKVQERIGKRKKNSENKSNITTVLEIYPRH